MSRPHILRPLTVIEHVRVVNVYAARTPPGVTRPHTYGSLQESSKWAHAHRDRDRAVLYRVRVIPKGVKAEGA